MYGRLLLLCFTALLFANDALATSSLPCNTPEDCKSIMGHEFKIQYRTSLENFVSEVLYSLQNAVADIGEVDTSNEARLKEITKTILEQREILEDSGRLSNEKLLGVIEKIKELKDEVQAINGGNFDLKPQYERVTKGMHRLLRNVLKAWDEASIVARSTDTTQMTGYDAINADVQRVKDVPITKDNEKDLFELETRILQFFGVDEILIIFPH